MPKDQPIIFTFFNNVDELLTSANVYADAASPEYKTSVYYYYIVRYLVVVHEATFAEIPIQVWNQYRNALDHFFRGITVANTGKQIKSIEGHLLRAVLDMSKLLCYRAAETLNQLVLVQNARILCLLDSGEFYRGLLEKQRVAHEHFVYAKLNDLNLGNDIEQDKQVVHTFLESCFLYISLISSFKDRLPDIERIKHEVGFYRTAAASNPLLASISGSVIEINNEPILVGEDGAVVKSDDLLQSVGRPKISGEEALQRIAENIRMNLRNFEENIHQARSEQRRFSTLTSTALCFGIIAIFIGVFISTLAISPGRGKLVKKDFPFSAVKYYLIRGRDRLVQIFPRPNSTPDEGQYV